MLLQEKGQVMTINFTLEHYFQAKTAMSPGHHLLTRPQVYLTCGILNPVPIMPKRQLRLSNR